MITDRFPSLKALILDMDGVLWKDAEPIIDFPKTFELINQLGLKVILATNNATKGVEEYLTKIENFGVNLEPQQILTSSLATKDYLRKNLWPDSQIYVVGTDSLKRLLGNDGFRIADIDEYQTADAVVVALDPHITYEKLANAALLIRNGARFIATNADKTFPSPKGLLPGAGAIVAAVSEASGTEPIIIGKPYSSMYEVAFHRLGLAAHQVMGIGDRLETDILGAQQAGCLSGLVLSGVSTEKAAVEWKPTIDVISADLMSLLNA